MYFVFSQEKIISYYLTISSLLLLQNDRSNQTVFLPASLFLAVCYFPLTFIIRPLVLISFSFTCFPLNPFSVKYKTNVIWIYKWITKIKLFIYLHNIIPIIRSILPRAYNVTWQNKDLMLRYQKTCTNSFIEIKYCIKNSASTYT